MIINVRRGYMFMDAQDEMKRNQPVKEATRQVSIRMRKSLHDSLEGLMSECSVFNSKPEFIMFSIRDLYLDVSRSRNDLASDERRMAMKCDLSALADCYDAADGDIIQITIRIPETFMGNIRRMSSILDLSMQDFYKAAMMRGINRLRDSRFSIVIA